jgi:hypothetical protein
MDDAWEYFEAERVCRITQAPRGHPTWDAATSHAPGGHRQAPRGRQCLETRPPITTFAVVGGTASLK